jgi:hypothetical protein
MVTDIIIVEHLPKLFKAVGIAFFDPIHMSAFFT